MRSEGFQMKRFYVRHDRSSMPVGTDGVLLGAWCPLAAGSTLRVLDAGTGCGLIALMVAQRIAETMGESGDWQVDAIDIDAASAEQAGENFGASPWSSHLRACQGDVRSWEGEYDLIVSNPPFYNQALASPDRRRAQARQAGVTMAFEELAEAAARLLKEDGHLGLILPCREEETMIQAATKNKLYVEERCTVSSKEGAAPNRVMMLLGRETVNIKSEHIVLTSAKGNRSEQYQQLTGKFYL